VSSDGDILMAAGIMIPDLRSSRGKSTASEIGFTLGTWRRD